MASWQTGFKSSQKPFNTKLTCAQFIYVFVSLMIIIIILKKDPFLIYFLSFALTLLLPRAND